MQPVLQSFCKLSVDPADAWRAKPIYSMCLLFTLLKSSYLLKRMCYWKRWSIILNPLFKSTCINWTQVWTVKIPHLLYVIWDKLLDKDKAPRFIKFTSPTFHGQFPSISICPNLQMLLERIKLEGKCCMSLEQTVLPFKFQLPLTARSSHT